MLSTSYSSVVPTTGSKLSVMKDSLTSNMSTIGMQRSRANQPTVGSASKVLIWTGDVNQNCARAWVGFHLAVFDRCPPRERRDGDRRDSRDRHDGNGVLVQIVVIATVGILGMLIILIVIILLPMVLRPPKEVVRVLISKLQKLLAASESPKDKAHLNSGHLAKSRIQIIRSQHDQSFATQPEHHKQVIAAFRKRIAEMHRHVT
mmetsp:Transcript_29912/g.96519  ORF Transcript_29912/g.96519 Transcript_29912/m.96519 type:complete len:204 (+) Transcript_29912:152-763(+)